MLPLLLKVCFSFFITLSDLPETEGVTEQMQNPRKVAFKALMKMESDEGYSNIVIDSALSSSDMERRDKGTLFGDFLRCA